HKIHIVCGPTLIELDFASFDPAEPLKLLFECSNAHLRFRVALREWHQNSNPPQSLALRARRARPPRRCRAAEQRDELAATDHSITSSTRASREGGISRPSAFAVVRLITRSNLVGCWTGRSAGFSPRKILST